MLTDPKYRSVYLGHIERLPHPLIPFLKVSHPTALYFLDRFRYARFFDSNVANNRYWTNWHRVKQTIQQEEQRRLEEQGRMLSAIFAARVAEEDSRAVDYLMWLDWIQTLYEKNLADPDFDDQGFVAFAQSDLIFDTELKETWVFK